MKFLQYFLLALTLFIVSCDDDDVTPTDDIEAPAGYSLLWHDEFNESDIDPDNWGFQTGDGTNYDLPAGWGNNELQLYTSNAENASRHAKTAVIATPLQGCSQGTASASDMAVLMCVRNYRKDKVSGPRSGCLEKISTRLIGQVAVKLISAK